MSMYNALFGENPLANHLMLCLGFKTKGDVGRYRDCFLNGREIAVYTRNGGGNRDDYCEVFETLRQHTNYLRDEDDDFDSTYATIYFSFPDEYKVFLEGLAAMTEQKFRPDKRWQDKLSEIQSGQWTPPEPIKELMKAITDFVSGS